MVNGFYSVNYANLYTFTFQEFIICAPLRLGIQELKTNELPQIPNHINI